MKGVEYVTEVKPRAPEWVERHVVLPIVVPPPEDFLEHKAWWEEWGWMVNYSVHKTNYTLAKKLAKELANEIHKVRVGSPWYNKKESQKRIKEILEQLRSIRMVPFEKRTPQEKWAHLLMQLPGDIGGPNKDKIRDLLSKRCKGRVLEAMCGFNSYLKPSPDREVVALDYCREALERYPYPERTRILFDLNKIHGNRRMEFFKEGEFDNITICFGFHYLQHPVCLFREFYRLLSSGGQLVLVENPHQCYRDLAVRSFSPKWCVNFLRRAGFDNVQWKELPIAEDWERKAGGYYCLIEAQKD